MANQSLPLTLTEISDRIQIQALLTEYSTAFEHGDWGRYAAVFTDDAVLDFSAAGGPRAGVTEATRWVAAAMAPVTTIQQLIGNYVITVDGDTATSRCTFQEGARRGAADGTESFIAVGGWYDDRLRRTERGWRIAERVETIAWVDGEMPDDLPTANGQGAAKVDPPDGSNLPEGMDAWIASVGEGRVTRLERHIARREAWVVDVTRNDGSVVEYFLRLDRASAQATSPWSVKKEMHVVEALHRAGLPVPEVFGWNDALQAVLYERARGREDLQVNTTPEQRRAVWEQFMRFVVDLHALEPRDLGLDDALAWPEDARAAALDEVDKLEQLMTTDVVEPLATFGALWLRRHAPTTLDRVVLVQGDTGPGNFLFENSELTTVIDFEWAHFGDPMEDFGNMAVREFFYPSAALAEVFPLYEKLGGSPIDYDRVRYYRVHQMVRSVIALLQMTTLNDPTTAVALNLCYRVICDRATCEAIADAMHIDLERPAALGPLPSAGGHTIGEVALDNLRREVLPAIDDTWARHQLEHSALLVECMDRVTRLGPMVDALEIDELTVLLGERPTTAATGLARLDAALQEWDGARDEDVLRYLARRAYRAEELYAPAVALFPDRQFSPLV